MLRLILLTPIESGTSTWKSLWSYCLFNCWPPVQVRVIKLIISPWFTTPNKTSALNAEPFKCSAFISVCCQQYCTIGTTVDAGLLGHYVRLCDIFWRICAWLYIRADIFFLPLLASSPIWLNSQCIYLFKKYNAHHPNTVSFLFYHINCFCHKTPIYPIYGGQKWN